MIEAKGLSFYHSEKSPKGIFNLSLKIPQGENLCLMGPSGSGKTTLLNLFSSKLKPAQGSLTNQFSRVSFTGDYEKMNEKNVVLDEIVQKITHDISEEKKINLARLALADLEITNEMNYPISKLSQGQKQRVQLAIIFANTPDLILLDEPFSALDYHLKNEIMSVLCKVCSDKKITLIWSSHNQEHALRFSHKIAILNYGKLEQLGSPTNIYYEPSNLFVAQFIGLNNIQAIEVDESSNSQLFNIEIKLVSKVQPNSRYLAMIRPEFIELKSGKEFMVESSYFSGSNKVYQLHNKLKAYSHEDLTTCNYSFHSHRVHIIGMI